MDLAQWREQRAQGRGFVLPSGLEVRLKRVSLMDLAAQGEVPAPLTGLVNQVMSSGLASITVENAAEYEAAINLVVKAAMVEPRVAEAASSDAVGVQELPIIDRLAIFRECNRYAEELKPFRREPEVFVESA